ncbi:MAG: choice-of-anchor B family protein [Bacteroidia bacterium]|nr:choice-of-anchor B family protein [Bacteroidia bacterium]
MNKIILSLTLVLTFCFSKAQVTYPSSNINLIGFINPETVSTSGGVKYSGCWGYNQTSKNKEYAVVGSSKGTYFIDITAPASPTVCDYVAGTSSPGVWREVNIYQNYAYVVSDNSPPNSFQIIDMQYLPDSVHVVHNSSTTHFERGHAVYVDVNKAKLYVSGIRFQGSGSANMRVYSLATPSAPVLLRTLAQDYPSITYVHDMFVRNDTVYAHCGNQGLHVYKLTASNTFTALGSLTGYADAGYCHSSSLTKDGKTLIMCDEVPTGLRIKSLDVSNLSNITVNALFRPNSNSQFVGHNPYVVGDKYAFVSCYQDGLYLYDISSPATPTIAGYFDTHPQGGASASNNYGSSSYNGNWGAFPYTKSGLIVACDMQNGVFILGATAFAPAANFNSAANICSGVATTFTDVSTNTPTSWSWNIPGASVTTSTLQNPSVTFTAGGVYNATLIATNASGTNSAVKSITVTATPTIITSGVSSICIGSSATLTASGASTYTWNPGALTGTNIVVSPTTTITYTVNGLNATCSGMNTKVLTVNPLPVVNANASSSLMCVGQTVTLSATGAASYTWMPGNITGNTIALSPTVSTTYSVVGTATTNCMNTSSAISVSVSACTGISSVANSENQFIISPNPNSGQFVIVGSSDAFDVSVYNSIGQLIKFMPQNRAKVNVDLSNPAKGIYYVVISSQGKRINRKLIID